MVLVGVGGGGWGLLGFDALASHPIKLVGVKSPLQSLSGFEESPSNRCKGD